MRDETQDTGKSRKLWYLLIWLEVMISVGFFVRSYFFPQYYAWMMRPEGKWLYELCGVISVCFTVIYFAILADGRERLGENVSFLVSVYTGGLLIAGFLKNSPYSGASALDSVFVRLLYAITEPPLDFWSFFRSLFPDPYGMVFPCISVGYCLAAGNLMINQYEEIRKNRLNVLLSFCYAAGIFCHREYLNPVLDALRIGVGTISVLAWILEMIRLRKNRKVLEKFQIFWLLVLYLVILILVGGLPPFDEDSLAGQLGGVTILRPLTWPLFLSGRISYAAGAILYLSLLVGMNLLCLLLRRRNGKESLFPVLELSAGMPGQADRRREKAKKILIAAVVCLAYLLMRTGLKYALDRRAAAAAGFWGSPERETAAAAVFGGSLERETAAAGLLGSPERETYGGEPAEEDLLEALREQYQENLRESAREEETETAVLPETGQEMGEADEAYLRIEEGYRAVYEQVFQDGGYEFTESSDAKGNLRVILSETDEAVEYLMYDRESENGECGLYVYFYVEKGEDGSWSPDSAQIRDIYAWVYDTDEVISSRKTGWGDPGSEAYRNATGE